MGAPGSKVGVSLSTGGHRKKVPNGRVFLVEFSLGLISRKWRCPELYVWRGSRGIKNCCKAIQIGSM
jgi:hypothetical protein